MEEFKKKQKSLLITGADELYHSVKIVTPFQHFIRIIIFARVFRNNISIYSLLLAQINRNFATYSKNAIYSEDFKTISYKECAIERCTFFIKNGLLDPPKPIIFLFRKQDGSKFSSNLTQNLPKLRNSTETFSPL